MTGPTTAWIGLGANLGEAAAAVREAGRRLLAASWARGGALSPLYGSAPVEASGPDYVNAVLRLEVTLAPHALLAELQALEQAWGRERPYVNAPRTLDLDLLAFGEVRLQDPVLTLPHPRLHQRAFVLRPWLDLAPDIALPGLGPLAAHLPAVAGQRLHRLAADAATQVRAC